jgi:formamidopyrimidine-DNA glycosylase
MPELPEVETVAARLDARLRGAVVESVRVLHPKVVARGPRQLGRAIARRTVRRVRRHGKRIIWELDPRADLNFHLGMTGNLTLKPRDAPLLDHVHLRVRFAGLREELRFRDPRRFGGVWLSRGGDGGAGRFSKPLGPDALAVRLREFRGLLRRRRQIKALLMDQQSLAGMGNIYCDESLFRSRIHPLTLASDLGEPQVAALLRAIRRVLLAAIAAGGSSVRDYRDADGRRGHFHVRHQVYGREGRPCPRCGTPIERLAMASRSTHLCPRCQPAPR